MTRTPAVDGNLSQQACRDHNVVAKPSSGAQLSLSEKYIGRDEDMGF